MASTALITTVGLNPQPNDLGQDDGSLIEGSNIVIQRDNVIQSRRGMKLFGNSFGSSSDRAKQRLKYKDIT